MSDPAGDNGHSSRYREALILVLVVMITVGFLFLVRNYILAIVMAFIFSALLWPVYQCVLRQFGNREVLASLAVLLATVLIVGLPLLGILSLVATEAVQVSDDLIPWLKQKVQPDGGESALAIPEWLPWAEELAPYQSTIVQKLGEWTGNLASYLVRSISSATQGAAIFALNLFVMLYAMFFFLMQGKKLTEQIVVYLPMSHEDSRKILKRGLTVTKATLKSILVIGLIQAVLLGGAFWVAGIEGAAFWGSIVLVLSAIPGLGTPVVWLPAAVYLILNDRIVAGVLLAIWGAVIVGTVDNLLRPRLVGQETKLPDLLILISTLGGIAAFGPLGIILGPVIAALFVTALGIYREIFL